MGMLGMHGNYAPNFMTNQCDLLIAVGTRFSDRVLGNPKKFAHQAKILSDTARTLGRGEDGHMFSEARREIVRAFTGLSGAASGGNAISKTWGTGENARDADSDLLLHLQTLADDAGLLPNRIWFGSTAWIKRFTTLRAASNSSVAASALLTPEQVAGLAAVDSVNVCNERYQGASGKSTLLSNNLVLLFNAQTSGVKDDPSNIKRFVTKVNGQDFAVFREEKAAGVDVTVAHQSLIAITSSLGVGKYTVS